jgi:hypothetical protein
MKRLLNQFLKENHLEAPKLIAGFESKPQQLGVFTKQYSCWLSGYKDELKKSKRFEGTYRVNKFIIRKQLQNLA